MGAVPIIFPYYFSYYFSLQVVIPNKCKPEFLLSTIAIVFLKHSLGPVIGSMATFVLVISHRADLKVD